MGRLEPERLPTHKHQSKAQSRQSRGVRLVKPMGQFKVSDMVYMKKPGKQKINNSMVENSRRINYEAISSKSGKSIDMEVETHPSNGK